MNEMKPEDVIRALECCENTEDLMACQLCPYYMNYGTDGCVHKLIKNALDLLREKDAEIEKLKSDFEKAQCSVELLGAELGKLGLALSQVEQIARAEAITEFEDLAIKRICEKVVAPTPSESYIVEKCNQIIYETAKEMRGKTDGESDL